MGGRSVGTRRQNQRQRLYLRIMSERSPGTSRFPLLAAGFEGALTPIAVALGWLLSKPPMETFHAAPYAFVVGVAAVGPMVLLLALCVRVPRWPWSDVLEVLDRVLLPMFEPCNLIELAAIALLAGLGEELLFRGVLQGAAADWLQPLFRDHGAAGPWGDWLAAVLVAVLFGLLHAANAAYAVLAGLIGFYLGWLWIVTGNLAVPITAHSLYDFLALMYLVKIRGRAEIREEGVGE